MAKITGFNDKGEVRIADDRGNLLAYGELHLENADITGIDSGDRFALEVRITWTPELPDPDDPDFGGVDWDRLLD